MNGAHRIVAKIGSTTIVGQDGRLDERFMASLAAQIAVLRSEDRDVVVVTSGAIAAALDVLGLSERPHDMPTLQACASVGQVVLIDTYTRLFKEQGLKVGQILLTRNDTASRTAYLHARDTMDHLMGIGIIPIVNENDTVAVEEIRFSDNDSLAAIVGMLIGADLVVLLSDVAGLYTADPRTDPEARLVECVDSIDDGVISGAGSSGTPWGTGGMQTKVRAGRAAQLAGIPLVICDGHAQDVLVSAVHGDAVGTRFMPPADVHESARKLWIGFAGCDAGRVVIDDGAAEALVEQGRSLLPVGVISVEGTFSRGDVIAVYDRQGTLIARGITAYSSDEAKLTHGMQLDMVGRIIADLATMPLIHRDELLVF